MTVESLKKAMKAEPFVPFTLKLASGNDAHIPHREFVFIHPETPRTIAIAEDGGFRVIDLLLVEELHFQPSGRRRRAG